MCKCLWACLLLTHVHQHTRSTYRHHHWRRLLQELCDKVSQLPSDIEWHFIGHLQSNKAKALVQSCPNLAMLETIDSEKLANKVDAAVEAAGRSPLPILIQVMYCAPCIVHCTCFQGCHACLPLSQRLACNHSVYLLHPMGTSTLAGAGVAVISSLSARSEHSRPSVEAIRCARGRRRSFCAWHLLYDS